MIAKLNFQQLLLQSSVSHYCSEIVEIYWFALQETFLIISVGNWEIFSFAFTETSYIFKFSQIENVIILNCNNGFGEHKRFEGLAKLTHHNGQAEPVDSIIKLAKIFNKPICERQSMCSTLSMMDVRVYRNHLSFLAQIPCGWWSFSEEFSISPARG